MRRELKSRQEYLSKLIKHIDSDAIKVITGIRCCGKSVLINLFYKFLLWREVDSKSIIYLNLDLPRHRDLMNPQVFHNYLSQKIVKKNKCYLLLDELQVVPNFEKAIESIRSNYDVDIYFVSSNSGWLSSDFISLFKDKYVEIKVLPLSFSEFIDSHDFDEDDSIDDKFQKYIYFGGMPGLTPYDFHEKRCFDAIESSYATALLHDILRTNKTVNYPVLEKVIKYLSADIGKTNSPNNISEALSNTNAEPSIVGRTVRNHIGMLERAYIFHTVNRYDIKENRVLKTLNKRYITDLGISNMLIGHGKIDQVYILENLVFLELLRRDFQVYVGKIKDMEIDFVAERLGERIYVQVAESINDEEIRENKLKPLKAINDNYEKIVLSMDKDMPKSYDGIKSINIIDWFLRTAQRIQSTI